MTDASQRALAGTAAESWRPATIVALERLTPRVLGVRLQPDVWRPFLPGQHVDVQLTAPDGYRAHRAYSIASPPGDAPTLELVVEHLDEGEVSGWFHDVAAVGDAVELRGPFAEHFVLRDSDAGPVLLLAGGSGVAPFLSMIRHRAARANSAPMTLVYSSRTWDEVIHREALLASEQAQDGFTVRFCLTRDQPRRADDVGRRIDRQVLDAALATLGAPPALVFICGGNRFVGTAADLLLAAGIGARAIRTERYGGD
jgi:ferredoxin-NADP reductase